MNGLSRALVAAGAVGAGCVAYGVTIERRWYRLHHVTLPGVLRREGTLRLLHVSDLHLLPGQEDRHRFLRRLGELDHDLAVVTGDLLGAVHMEELAARTLAPLTSDGRPGLVVLGSNDLYAPVLRSPLAYFRGPSDTPPGATRLDTDLLIRALRDHGFETLIDEATTVTTRAGTVAVGGLHDPHLGGPLAAPEHVAPPPADGAESAALHLGLVHAPYLAALDVLVDAGHDLLLSGHTHGGQVRLPGIGALVANCDLPLRQARGASRYRSRWLHVSAGLGHGRYAPFRFACRPEATLLELTG